MFVRFYITLVICIIFVLIGPLRTVSCSKLVFLLVDGLRSDDVAETESLQQLINSGVNVHEVLPNFPSVAYPNYMSLFTGLYPESHGLTDDFLYDYNTKQVFVDGTIFSTAAKNEAIVNHFNFSGTPFWQMAKNKDKNVSFINWPGCELLKKHRCIDSNVIDLQDLVSEELDRMEANETEMIFVNAGSAVSAIGLAHGPESLLYKQALRTMDSKIINWTLTTLSERGMQSTVNLVVASLFGLSSRKRAPLIVDLSRYAPAITKFITPPIGGAHLPIYPKKSEIAKVFNLLYRKAHRHIHVYWKYNLPERLRLRKGRYMAPVLVVADPGWIVVTSKAEALLHEKHRYGYRGYDSQHSKDMRGMFAAVGPDFNAGKSLKQISVNDIYNLLCHLAGFEAAANNGTWSNIEPLLAKKHEPKQTTSKIKTEIVGGHSSISTQQNVKQQYKQKQQTFTGNPKQNISSVEETKMLVNEIDSLNLTHRAAVDNGKVTDVVQVTAVDENYNATQNKNCSAQLKPGLLLRSNETILATGGTIESENNEKTRFAENSVNLISVDLDNAVEAANLLLNESETDELRRSIAEALVEQNLIQNVTTYLVNNNSSAENLAQIINDNLSTNTSEAEVSKDDFVTNVTTTFIDTDPWPQNATAESTRIDKEAMAVLLNISVSEIDGFKEEPWANQSHSVITTDRSDVASTNNRNSTENSTQTDLGELQVLHETLINETLLLQSQNQSNHPDIGCNISQGCDDSAVDSDPIGTELRRPMFEASEKQQLQNETTEHVNNNSKSVDAEQKIKNETLPMSALDGAVIQADFDANATTFNGTDYWKYNATTELAGIDNEILAVLLNTYVPETLLQDGFNDGHNDSVEASQSQISTSNNDGGFSSINKSTDTLSDSTETQAILNKVLYVEPLSNETLLPQRNNNASGCNLLEECTNNRNDTDFIVDSSSSNFTSHYQLGNHSVINQDHVNETFIGQSTELGSGDERNVAEAIESDDSGSGSGFLPTFEEDKIQHEAEHLEEGSGTGEIVSKEAVKKPRKLLKINITSEADELGLDEQFAAEEVPVVHSRQRRFLMDDQVEAEQNNISKTESVKTTTDGAILTAGSSLVTEKRTTGPTTSQSTTTSKIPQNSEEEKHSVLNEFNVNDGAEIVQIFVDRPALNLESLDSLQSFSLPGVGGEFSSNAFYPKEDRSDNVHEDISEHSVDHSTYDQLDVHNSMPSNNNVGANEKDTMNSKSKQRSHLSDRSEVVNQFNVAGLGSKAVQIFVHAPKIEISSKNDR